MVYVNDEGYLPSEHNNYRLELLLGYFNLETVLLTRNFNDPTSLSDIVISLLTLAPMKQECRKKNWGGLQAGAWFFVLLFVELYTAAQVQLVIILLLYEIQLWFTSCECPNLCGCCKLKVIRKTIAWTQIFFKK